MRTNRLHILKNAPGLVIDICKQTGIWRKGTAESDRLTGVISKFVVTLVMLELA